MPQAKDGGREMNKSLPQSNATHLTAPSERGRKRRAIRESPLQPVGNGLDRSANRPVYGEVARAKRVTEGQITSKSTGGRVDRPYGWIDTSNLYFKQRVSMTLMPISASDLHRKAGHLPCGNPAQCFQTCQNVGFCLDISENMD